MRLRAPGSLLLSSGITHAHRHIGQLFGLCYGLRFSCLSSEHITQWAISAAHTTMVAFDTPAGSKTKEIPTVHPGRIHVWLRDLIPKLGPSQLWGSWASLDSCYLYLAQTVMFQGWQEDGPSPVQPINNSISTGPAEARPIPALLGTDKPQEPS